MEQGTFGADVCVGAVGLGCAGMSGAYGPSAAEPSTSRGDAVAQLAIVWGLAQGRDIVALAGAGRPHRITEAVDAAGLRPIEADLDTVEQAAGERDAPALLSLLDSERTGGRP
ncbi:hypothetical protein [Nonomuraea rubra]|uniref:Aryl-alcohol dehydrogenase-like predicted oxidoreductase n=1 Tax=Nonomuraea rubra TaxID=46180 RepID=A0A7X0U1Q8_9ACTN|nr:hypothetical protein [Nonomuraea rubra]MBB6551848.1 aryl-alcohol dehydrogenase-like predicted oxidoreductase [Nonomuraea rubra]